MEDRNMEDPRLINSFAVITQQNVKVEFLNIDIHKDNKNNLLDVTQKKEGTYLALML